MSGAFLRSRAPGPAVVLALALALAFPSAAPAIESVQDPAASESAVKAVFLFNFIRYLEWRPDDGLEVCPIAVLGDSGVVAPLREIAERKTVGMKPIQVERYEDVDAVGFPRILFLSDSVSNLLPDVLKKFRGRNVLIVGETEGLAARGAAINFVIRDESVKFEVNLKALEATGIQAGSQLLRLAILVDGDRAAPAT